nr:SBBP repeat-containing protein [Bacteroidota bacterium]
MKKLLFILWVLFAADCLSQAGLSWAKKIGSKNADGAYRITVDQLGNSYTIGSFSDRVDFDPGVDTCYLTALGNFDVYVCKFNALGKFLWAKRFGSTNLEYGIGICTDNDQNVYLTGKFSGYMNLNYGTNNGYLGSYGDYDIFIFKLNTNGDLIWARKIGGSGADAPTDIAVDHENNVYTSGFFNQVVDFDPGDDVFYLESDSFGPYGDGYINKLDPNGNFAWARKIAGAGYPYNYAIACDPENNLLLTGSFNQITDMDPGKGIVTFTSASYPLYLPDIFISKFNTHGIFTWCRQIAGRSRKEPRDLAVDKNGFIYLTGNFSDTTDFDPGLGTFDLMSDWAGDMFVSKYNSNCSLEWVKQITDTGGWTVPLSIGVDKKGSVYTTGYFSNADFDPGPAYYFLQSPSVPGLFVSQLNANGEFECAFNLGNNSPCGTTGQGLAIGPQSELYVCGVFSRTIDFDPSAQTLNLTAEGIFDGFVARYSSCSEAVAIEEAFYSVGDPIIYPNPTNGLLNFKNHLFNELKVYN